MTVSTQKLFTFPLLLFTSVTLFRSTFALPQSAGATQSTAASSSTCVTKPTDFPPMNKWKSPDEMFNTWKPIWKTDTGKGSTTDDEAQTMKTSIDKYAAQSGINAAFIYAVVAVESVGKATVPCNTNDSPKSCGLMQDKGTSDAFYSAVTCTAHPCKNIDTMLQAGIVGGVNDQGDWANLQKQFTGAKDQSTSYANTARAYNTGSIPQADDLTQAGPGSRNYVNKIASYLIGSTILQGELCGIGFDT